MKNYMREIMDKVKVNRCLHKRWPVVQVPGEVFEEQSEDFSDIKPEIDVDQSNSKHRTETMIL